ncbi:MAG: ROK family protein [Rhodospirillales bacterium]|jgi:fructokinase|nr:ROK family protein [Rhodospirillales bacterium]
MRIGIDLGGTKIEGIALDSDGRELARIRKATPKNEYNNTLETISEIVKALESKTAQHGSVGLGIPGMVSPSSGLVKNANSTCLIGKPLDRDLEAILERPIRLTNDANCFTVSEAADGSGAHCNVVFGVILGTGVGGGLVIKGTAHTGMNAIAGEWGHNPLPWMDTDEMSGPECYCGKAGCIETFLSGPGLELDYLTHGGPKAHGAEDIARLATQGDEVASNVLSRYEQRLARALASVINILDPDMIVLGGGISNIDQLYDSVPRLWQDWVFSDRTDTPLRKNTHGDSSGVRGAAWLWA